LIRACKVGIVSMQGTKKRASGSHEQTEYGVGKDKNRGELR